MQPRSDYIKGTARIDGKLALRAAVCYAAGVLPVGYGLYAEVMRENACLSRTVEVQEGRQVISAGLYGVVTTDKNDPQGCICLQRLRVVCCFGAVSQLAGAGTH